jgi:class 3 adenylate cyclase
MARFRVAHLKIQGVDLVMVPLSADFSALSGGEKALVSRQVTDLCRAARLGGTVVPVWPTAQGTLGFIAEDRLHGMLTEHLKGAFLKTNLNRELQVAVIPSPTSKVLRDLNEPVAPPPQPAAASPGAEATIPPVAGLQAAKAPLSQPPEARGAEVRFERAEKARGRRDDSYPLRLVTMLFTDIIGSTRIKSQMGDHRGMDLIRRHHELVRTLLATTVTGEEIKTSGDSFFIVFSTPSEALTFALQLQKRLRTAFLADGVKVADRVGIHVGEVYAEKNEDGTFSDLNGSQVDTAARVMSLGTGDQILLSRFAYDNARSVLRGQSIPEVGNVSWMKYGDYELKGVEDDVEICEVGETGFAYLRAPPDGAHGRRIFSK